MPSDAPDQPLPLSPREGFFTKYAWLAFLGPLIMYMLLPMLTDLARPDPDLPADHYAGAMQVYANNLFALANQRALLLVPVLLFLVRAIRWPPFRISWLAVLVGVVGVVLWVGIDAIGLRRGVSLLLDGLLGEENWLTSFLFPARDATNPGELYGAGTFRYWYFMVTRFIGLALFVPLAEELMLRGWLMRMVDNADFWKVRFGEVTMRAAVIGVAFATLYHPEKLASIVWFSLTTWLMFRTKNFWDCVTAHAVTNFLLGVWVVWRGAWELW